MKEKQTFRYGEKTMNHIRRKLFYNLRQKPPGLIDKAQEQTGAWKNVCLTHMKIDCDQINCDMVLSFSDIPFEPSDDIIVEFIHHLKDLLNT